MITIVGGRGCNYCNLAKDFLQFKGVDYNYVDYKEFPLFKEDGHKTIPQIYYRRGNGSYLMLTDEGYEGLIGIADEYLMGLPVNFKDEDYKNVRPLDKGEENVVDEGE